MAIRKGRDLVLLTLELANEDVLYLFRIVSQSCAELIMLLRMTMPFTSRGQSGPRLVMRESFNLQQTT